jgi:heme exporter protein D
LIDFFAMGGYGAYVWSAFGFAALVLVGLLVQSWRVAERREVELERLRQLVRPARGGRARQGAGSEAGASGGGGE